MRRPHLQPRPSSKSSSLTDVYKRQKDDGSAPWTSDWNIGDVNQKNEYASVDSNGFVTVISAGDTTLHAFGRNGVTKVDGAYVETQKNITVVEVCLLYTSRCV